jgi:hypothetical protein
VIIVVVTDCNTIQPRQITQRDPVGFAVVIAWTLGIPGVGEDRVPIDIDEDRRMRDTSNRESRHAFSPLSFKIFVNADDETGSIQDVRLVFPAQKEGVLPP